MNDNTAPTRYLLVFSGEGKKIGLRSTGQIRFQLLTDPDRQTLWLRLSGNDASGGFSTEPVAFSTIESCVQGVQAGRPLASKALAACFTGRSANNGPFLCAALRSLGLLCPAPDNSSLSQPSGDWQEWKKTMLQAEGSDFVIPPKEKLVGKEAPSQTTIPEQAPPEHREAGKHQGTSRKTKAPPVKEHLHADPD